MDNGSTEETLTREFDMYTFSMVVDLIISVLGIVGNGLVIYVAGFRMKRTINTVWFLNLAAADFLVTAYLTVSIGLSFLEYEQWSFGHVLCITEVLVWAMNLFASVFTLLCISVDRCLVTTMAVWAQNKRTICKAKLVCLGIWITAGFCSIPLTGLCDEFVNHNITHVEDYYPVMSEKFKIIRFFQFAVGFLIPFAGISISHVTIYCRVRRLQTTRNGKPRKIIIAVILAFFFCCFPLHIVNLYMAYAEKQQIIYVAHMVLPPVVSLAFFNSCLNPILYVFMSKDFWKKLKQSLCLVLESAMTEEHEPHTVSGQFSRINQKSESVPPENTDSVWLEVKSEVNLEDNDMRPNNANNAFLIL